MEQTPILESFRSIIANPWVLGAWVGLLVLCVIVVVRDLWKNNTGIMPMMKMVWTLTVLYSGPIGLAIYWGSGRKWIKRDSLWRRGWRSDAHCYSGCGAGEIMGIVLMVGILAVTNNWLTALVTFALAYTFGFALTVGPLMQGGTPFPQASRDAFWSETSSIVVMEAAAIGSDLWVAGSATMGQLLFWGSLILSLSVGLLVAYPVNVALIHWGVKKGMMDPRRT